MTGKRPEFLYSAMVLTERAHEAQHPTPQAAAKNIGQLAIWGFRCGFIQVLEFAWHVQRLCIAVPWRWQIPFGGLVSRCVRAQDGIHEDGLRQRLGGQPHVSLQCLRSLQFKSHDSAIFPPIAIRSRQNAQCHRSAGFWNEILSLQVDSGDLDMARTITQLRQVPAVLSI